MVGDIAVSAVGEGGQGGGVDDDVAARGLGLEPGELTAVPDGGERLVTSARPVKKWMWS